MSNRRLKLAKLFVIIPTIWYGIVPPIIDFNTSHVLNPDWTGHARFHMVWLLVLNMLLSISCLLLIFKKIPSEIIGLRIAACISFCVYAGFFISTWTMKIYGGSLSDGNGVPPIMGIDGNVLVFTPLSIILMIGLYLSWTIKPSKTTAYVL